MICCRNNTRKLYQVYPNIYPLFLNATFLFTLSSVQVFVCLHRNHRRLYAFEMCNVHIHTPYGFCASVTISRGVCSIQVVFVFPCKRGQGNGQRLLLTCLQRCSCTLVILDDMSGADQSENIYVKAGLRYQHLCARTGKIEGPEMIARVSYTRRKLRQDVHRRLLRRIHC
jgi:GNAT superfamily N-acetyltransferase